MLARTRYSFRALGGVDVRDLNNLNLELKFNLSPKGSSTSERLTIIRAMLHFH